MRNYKSKMAKYRLTKRQYTALREYCKSCNESKEAYIRTALELTVSDRLSQWLYRHVTSDYCPWRMLEADGIPCNEDTFRYYRAKFYWNLERLLDRTID